MKFDQLQYFLELARTEHVGQAAKKLRISPSAISHALAALEEELGGELFDRDGRRLVLNERGRRMAARVEGIVESVARLPEAMNDQSGELSGHYRLGAPHSLAADCMARVWARLGAKHPRLEGTMASHGSRAVLDLLESGDLDIAMGFEVSAETAPKLEQEVVHEGRLVACARRDHPIATFEGDDLIAKLQSLPLAMPMGSGLDELMRHPVLGTLLSRRKKIDFRYDSYDVAAAYAAATDAYTVIPEWAYRFRESRLTRLKLDQLQEHYRVVVVWQKRRTGDSTIAAVVSEARAVLSELF